MLNAMRKNLKKLSWVLWLVIATFVGTIFAVWGVGGGGGKSRSDVVAWIDEKPVTVHEFYETRQRLRSWYQQIYGERFAELEERLQLSDAALSQIIQIEAMKKAASDLNIPVSDDDVKTTIAEMEEFSEDGRFSRRRYQLLLKRNRINESDFIEQMRADLARKKVQQLLSDAIWVSDDELKEMYRINNEMVRLDYIQINSRSFVEGIEPTDKQIEEFFEKKRENYQIPDKVSVRYIEIDPNTLKEDQEFKDQLSITNDEIEEYYYSNDTKFKSEKEVRARHILFKSEGTDEEADKIVRQKAEEVLTKLKDGTDFEEMAKKYSEDTTAANGGDLGFFPRRGRMVEPFSKAAFELEPGQISDIVKTRYGYHIIKTEEIKEESIKELEDVREEIRTTLIDQAAQQYAEKKSERIRERFTAEEGIDALAKRFNLEVVDTPLFAEREVIPDLGWMQEFTKVAFTLEPNEISPPVNEKAKYYLLVLKERVQAHQAQFNEVTEQVKNDLISDLALQKANERMENIEKKIDKGVPWDTLADGEAIKIGDTGLFSRKQSIKGIGRDEDLARESFQQEVGSLIGPKEIRKMLYYFKVAEKQAPDWTKYEDEKETLRKQQLTSAGNKYFNNWIEQIKNEMEVVKNQTFFNKLSS